MSSNIQELTQLLALQKLLQSRLLFCIMISIPALPLVYDLVDAQIYYGEIMSRSGVWASALMVVTLMITPVRLAVSRFDFLKTHWIKASIRLLMQRRRYLGVAAFGYALLHTLFYLRKIDEFQSIVDAALIFENLTGWIAFLIFLMLAVTSNDFAVRKMGERWQTLHRLIYPAAILVFIH